MSLVTVWSYGYGHCLYDDDNDDDDDDDVFVPNVLVKTIKLNSEAQNSKIKRSTAWPLLS